MFELKPNMKLHFIGIGGAGMLPLAVYSRDLGYFVAGSDLSDENFHILRSAGINPEKGNPGVAADTDLVIYSSAVKDDNEEMISAKKLNIPRIKRAEFLGLITKYKHSVLVSGSHGKSTTSAMLADILNGYEKINATALVGAETVSKNSNYYKGSGEHVILEADEYDRSFLKLFPSDLIILNIDDDHMDIYGDIEGLKKAFTELTGRLKEDSILIYNGDDEAVVQAVSEHTGRKVSYGLNDGCIYRAKEIEFKDFSTRFIFTKNGSPVTDLNYYYSGIHNVYNMLASAALLSEYGIDGKIISELALKFKGVKRRQEIIFRNDDYILIDDYGHHPSEVRSSLNNLRLNHSGRMIVMFQPHLYSRTKYHSKGFAESFNDADIVLISQIYPAREKFDPSVSGKNIYMDMNETERRKTTVFDNFDDLYLMLKRDMKPGDLIVSMGAGEINKLLYKLKKELGNK
ncbi:MAG TPA: UDP-N-acetylmuramate--L-alanine ligase [Clostridiales bacterium]|nr:UDP-N-acetylmuramate--L-alanine ligase [Clostridiales bacterium]HQP69467.1 UDP-N-acetylmuramate--L-alanine ligase [Clostridiales bacterium]